MRPRRINLVVDVNASLDVIDGELAAWRDWMTSDGLTELSVGLIVCGGRAGWVPAATTNGLAGSAVVRGVAAAASSPALADALSLVADDECDALVTMLAREPAPGWEAALDAIGARLRACVSLSPEPVLALGRGHLGAPFRQEHLGLALRWVTCELCDRTWRCPCGELRHYPDEAGSSCPACGGPPMLPPRLRIGDRVILLAPNARLYAHHVGQALDFDRTLAVLDQLEKRDGSVSIAGFAGEIRTGPTASTSPGAARQESRRFRPSALRGLVDRCSACEGQLVEPFLHEPPDPRRFCSGCVASEARCDFCSVPLGLRPNTWPDGRTACRDCWLTAVTEAAALETLGDAARAWMHRRLGMEMPACPLHFEHAAGIARMHGSTFRPAPQFNARPIGFFRKPLEAVDGGAALFVEHGVPRALAYGILVHELTHLWQWHHWPHDCAVTLVEGLAMWVEYHALLDAGAIHTARHTERYGDPIYGLGFRIALLVEKQVGFDLVKDRMQSVVASSGGGA